MSRIDKKIYNTALLGVMLALTVMAVFAASVVPGAEMTLYAVSGLFTGIIIMESGIKNALMLYVGAVLLSFFLVPDKTAIVPYGIFFGLYGFAKYFAEKASAAVTQLVLKMIFFIAIGAIAYFGFRKLFLGDISLPNLPWPVLAVGAIVVCFLYDYIYTLALALYRSRVKRESVNFKLSTDEKDKSENERTDKTRQE